MPDILDRGGHVYRWLRSLVEWHTSTQRFMALASKCRKLEATLVYLADHAGCSLSDANHEAAKASLREAVKMAAGSDERVALTASNWLEKNLGLLPGKFWGHVHAEAGLMALVYAATSNQSLQRRGAFADVFAVSRPDYSLVLRLSS
jgi:hypothetical protein